MIYATLRFVFGSTVFPLATDRSKCTRDRRRCGTWISSFAVTVAYRVLPTRGVNPRDIACPATTGLAAICSDFA